MKPKAYTTDHRKRNWERIKENSKYYSDLSKLCFASLILTQFSAIQQGGSFDIGTFLVGTIATISLKVISLKIINKAI